MLTTSFYWFLAGLLFSAFSACFLYNDLKNRRTYLLVGVDDTSERKIVVRHDRSPALFNIIVWGVALCTAYTVVTGFIGLLASAESTAGLLDEMESWQVVLAFIPDALVLMYVLQSISVRVFASWWDAEAEGPQTLGIGNRNRKDKSDNRFE